MATAFRPAALARYSARSAVTSRSPSTGCCGSNSASPMLTVTSAGRIPQPAPDPLDPRPERLGHPRRRPAGRCGSGSPRTRRRRSAPPRPRRAPRCRISAATASQDLVARLVAVPVVHLLEPVEVEEQHREPLLAPLAALDLVTPAGRAAPGRSTSPVSRSTAAARCASSARRSWYGVHCRSVARPSAAASANRWQVAKPQAPQSHGPPVRARARSASRTAATASGSGAEPPRLDGERGADARHHRRVHHRLPAPRRLGARQQRPPPVQLLPRARRAGGPAPPRCDRMSTKPRSSRSTATARASAGSASSPRIFRNRRLECRASSSSASGSPPAALRCRRRSSGTRCEEVGLRRARSPRGSGRAAPGPRR